MKPELPQNQENQEIDLLVFFTKITNFFQSINILIFNFIQFIISKIIIISVLIFVGFCLGFIIDTNFKKYQHQIIVEPNFQSTNYLYSKIQLLQSKIGENDSVFLKEVVGTKNPRTIIKIEIEPINDVFKFIENKAENFELIKLLAENGDINKVLEQGLTSRNYRLHTILITTNQPIVDQKLIESLMGYLNNTDYYKKIQYEMINNLQIKIKQNDSIISQIDNVLLGFSNSVNSNTKSNQLVYYNENTQLNEIIKTKENLINEQGNNRLSLVLYNKVIKENSITLNILDKKFINGKLKLLFPILFLGLFFIISILTNYYRSHLNRVQSL